jgi:hypothetical protein
MPNLEHTDALRQVTLLEWPGDLRSAAVARSETGHNGREEGGASPSLGNFSITLGKRVRACVKLAGAMQLNSTATQRLLRGYEPDS